MGDLIARVIDVQVGDFDVRSVVTEQAQEVVRLQLMRAELLASDAGFDKLLFVFIVLCMCVCFFVVCCLLLLFVVVVVNAWSVVRFVCA